MSVLVVHCMRDPYDVYVGRGPDPNTGIRPPVDYGNPFSHKTGTSARFKVASMQEAVVRHNAWLDTQPQLLATLSGLRGKVLSCWCAPSKWCHAHNLSRRANGSPASLERRRLLDEERAEAALFVVRGTDSFVAWPKGFEQFNACTDPCDMWDGPCACGATHRDGR